MKSNILIMMLNLILIQIVAPLTFSLLDQQAVTDQCFNNWIYFDGTNAGSGSQICKSYTCGGRGTFFGPLACQAYLQRTYTSLDIHTKVQIKLTLIKLELFGDDDLAVSVDSTPYTITYGNSLHSAISSQFTFSNEASSQECTVGLQGTVSGEDAQIDLILTLAHTNPTLNLKLYYDYLSTSGAWGVRSVKVYLEVDCNIACNKCSTTDVCTVCAFNRQGTPTCACPAKTYDNGQPECPSCLSQCATCINGTTCSSCAANSHRSGSLCACDSGYYESNGSCLQCLNKCSSCNDGTSCTQCASSRSGNNCDCNSGLYDLNGVCTICSTKCSSCNASNGNCTTCATNRDIIPTCDCKLGYFDSNNSCLLCDSICTNCSGSATNCVQCSTGRSGSQCKCNTGTYELNGSCTQCLSQCSSCENGSNCLSCSVNRSLPDCNCDTQFYEQSGICKNCAQNCLTCNSNGCLSCQAKAQILPDCDCPTGTELKNNDCVVISIYLNPKIQFSDDLSQIIITFDQNIETSAGIFAQTPSSSNCDVIQNMSSKCYLSANKFYIDVNESMSLKIGSMLILIDDGINLIGQSGSSFNPIQIEAPSDPVTLSFSVAYSSKVLSCKTNQITLTNFVGFGSRKPIISYSSSPSLGQLGTESQITLPTLTESSYSIAITASNFIGMSTSKTIEISVQNSSTLNVQFNTNLGNYYAYQQLQFDAIIVALSCNSTSVTNKVYTIQWTLNGISEPEQTVTTNMLSKIYSANTFIANSKHTLQIQVTYDGIVSKDTLQLTVSPAPILVSILGGSKIVSAKKSLTLTGIVVDSDNIGYTPQWLCVISSTGASCPITFTNTLSQTIPPNTLIGGNTYTIQLKAATISNSITLVVHDDLQQEIFVNYPARYNVMPVNLDEKLIFIVQIIQDGVTYQIDSSSTMKYNIIQNGVTTYSKQVSTSVIAFQLNQFEITANSLTIQFVYDTLISFVTIQVNQPPTPGNLEIISEGIAMDTQFVMALNNFSDQNLPLQFQFLAQVSPDLEILLTDWQTSNIYSSKLPQGVYPNYQISIKGKVSDSLGSITTITKTIICKPTTRRRRILQESITNLLTTMTTATDDELVTIVYQYQQMQQGGCQKGCSNHGTCSSSSCVCTEGYYLDDCSATQEEFNELVKLMNSVLEKLQSTSESDLTDSKKDQLARSIQTILARPEIVDNMDQASVDANLAKSLKSLDTLFTDNSISKANIENMIEELPDPQKNRRSRQVNSNVASQTGVVDKLFAASSIDSSSKYNSKDDQDKINKKLMNASRSVASFQANQLFADEDANVRTGTNLDIKAQRLTQGQSTKYFPYSNYLVSSLTDDELQVLNEVGMADDVEMSSMTFNTNPYCADSQFPYSNSTNQMAGANFKDSNGNPTKPRKSLAYTLKAKPSDNNICVTQTDGEWSSGGCSTLNNLIDGSSQCSCDSITEITIVDDIAEMFQNSNLDALWNPSALADFAFWESALFYISLTLTICWVICLLIGYKKDINDLKLYVKAETEAEEEKNQKLNEVKKLNEADDESDEEMKKQQKELQQNRKIAKDFTFGFPMLHQFISIFTVFSDEQPRPARFTIYFLKMIIMMALTSIFGKNLSITQNVVFAVMCVALMAPITAALIKGFAHDASKVKKILSIIFIIIIFGGCWYVCLVVAAKLGVEDSNNWSITYILSVICDVAVMETMTIFLKLVLAPYIKSHIHSGNFMIRLMYLYLFEKNLDIILSRVYG